MIKYLFVLVCFSLFFIQPCFCADEFLEEFSKKQLRDSKEVPDWIVSTLTKAGYDMSFVPEPKNYKGFSD